MKILIGLSLFSFALTQGQVVVEKLEGIPTVLVSDAAFADMCADLAKRLRAKPGVDIILLRPKPLPPGEDERMGEVWEAINDFNVYEVPATYLPPVLQRLRGKVARSVELGSCRLKDNLFYKKSDILFITSDDVDAKVLAGALSKVDVADRE